MHQCGSVREAVAARRAGADAVIAQGIESGGHVRGSAPATELLAQVREALGAGYPVLSAGGVADRRSVRARIAAGSEAVVCGTRFLMTDQSGAHPGYRERLRGSRETLLTELFGVGWPAPHRVVPNAATARWLSKSPLGPSPVRALNRVTSPLASRLPASAQRRLAASQTAHRPFFGPIAPTADGPAGLVDAGPLYAGECVASITDVRDAGVVVRELTP
jgi:NAD(P)H-dependent flavin oxidoreductase YrpB (nitropropane dioxygenase family)